MSKRRQEYRIYGVDMVDTDRSFSTTTSWEEIDNSIGNNISPLTVTYDQQNNGSSSETNTRIQPDIPEMSEQNVYFETLVFNSHFAGISSNMYYMTLF